MANDKLYRYPGAVCFTTEQAHLFEGRDNDTQKLWQLISARQVVLLYGKSGTGKSSLINAGLIPLLERDKKANHFTIRLYNSNQGGNEINVSPIKTLINSLTNQEVLAKKNLLQIEDIENPWMEEFKRNAYPKGELWYWLKQWQLYQPEQPIILFFDQFEELFTYSPEEIEVFGEELKTLIYEKIPGFLNKKEYFKTLSEEQADKVYTKINLKLVFAIRSDRMALLNKLSLHIPEILKHFYELEAISEKDARNAIIQPAQLKGDFQSPNFQFENTVVDAILERVKNKYDGKIETATLQIICRFIESQKVSQANSIITLNDLGNVKDIFRDFYQSTLNQLNTEDKAKVSKSIEERFIQNNQRIPFAGEYLKLEDKWTDELFKQLEESTLLRKERDTAGRFMYEIGHDTLIEPIVEFANERKTKEKEEQLKEQNRQQALENERQQQVLENKRLQQLQALENKNLQDALKARKKLLKYAVVAGVVLLGLLGCTLYQWYDANESKRIAYKEKQNADSARNDAVRALNQVYYEQAKVIKDNGVNIYRNEYPKIAKVFYDSALKKLSKIIKPDTLGIGLKNELIDLKKKKP